MADRRVAIVQEYIPDYRIEFFRGLIDGLASIGIDIVLVAGESTGSQKFRDRGAEFGDHLRRATPRKLAVSGLEAPVYGNARYWSDCVGVVMQLRGVSIDLNLELFKKMRSGRRVGVWGHVVPSVKPGHWLDLAIERRQMRNSDHVFAYTNGGAESAISAGVDPRRVTSVMNSIDVTQLLSAYDSIDSTSASDFKECHALTPGKTFSYVGRLDAEKRIDFLAQTLDRLWEVDKNIKVLVGGRGPQEEVLRPAANRGQAVLMGFVDAREMAQMARISEAFLNPGHIGLLAVECLSLGVPIITTDHKFQSPEFEYLTIGADVLISRDNPSSFAQLVLELVNDVGRAPKHVSRPYPTIGDMVDNFANGIEAMIS